jgi:hypothetical protein
MNFFISFLFFCSLFHYTLSAPAGCSSLSAGNAATLSRPSVCYGVLDYDFYHGIDSCPLQIEQSISSLPTLWSIFPDGPCRVALSKFTCTFAHRQCSNPSAAYPCNSVCVNLQSSCGPLWPVVQSVLKKNNFPMDCSHPAYNMTNCNPGPSTQPISIRVPRCEQYKGTICAGVVENNIYIPTGLTQVHR